MSNTLSYFGVVGKIPHQQYRKKRTQQPNTQTGVCKLAWRIYAHLIVWFSKFIKQTAQVAMFVHACTGVYGAGNVM